MLQRTFHPLTSVPKAHFCLGLDSLDSLLSYQKLLLHEVLYQQVYTSALSMYMITAKHTHSVEYQLALPKCHLRSMLLLSYSCHESAYEARKYAALYHFVKQFQLPAQNWDHMGECLSMYLGRYK